MPNTRRRRFSVRDSEVTGRELKLQNALQSSHSNPDPDSNLVPPNVVTTKSSKSKHKVYANSSKYSSMQLVSDNASSSAVSSAKKSPYRTMDKDVAASSSNIDLFNDISYEYPYYAGRSKSSATGFEIQKKTMSIEKRDEKREHSHSRARTPTRRDKIPRQHRIKVRSPKRRVAIMEQPNKPVDSNSRSIGTTAIDWGVEIELFSVDDIADLIESTEDEERISTHSYDDMCRICHGGASLTQELGSLISACSCRGTVGRVHVKCLERWLTESGKSKCELCGTRYVTRRVHKYGVPRALVMWVLSHNAKQLMVDSLGIMLMSPLAVLAAWLSGRTLAGLMTQESQITPWPLASTFVLACMTLVCYYCWIVSAATRHALGWWIWYRSQYEVRLQLQETEEQT